MTLNPPSEVLPRLWQPLDGQKKGIKFLLEHACAGLIADPGVGKTSISLAAFKILKKKKLVTKVLVIAPRRPCYEVWPAEIFKWLDFNGITYTILHGPDKDERLKLDTDLHIINFEGLEWLFQVVKTRTPKGKTRVTMDLARFKRLGYDMVIVDELSKFKHPGSVRFKAMKLVIKTFARRWGLTGSPAANGLMGLFGQCYALDEGRTLGQYITHYRSKYFDQSYNGYGYELKDGAEKQIFDRVKPLMIRLEATGLPPVVDNDIWVELPDEARRVYDQLDEDLLTKIDKNVIIAANAGVASMKCRQVASGGLYLDPETRGLLKVKTDRKWVNLHDEKTEALKDLVEELQGTPLLVAYDFKHDLDRIWSGLNKDIPYIGGGVTDKRAGELVKLWNQGKLPILLGHPQSIGHGLNLQEASNHVCWYSPTWDFELYDQFIRRVRRQGNKASRIFNHRILAKDTIDLDIILTLASKNRGQNLLFAALKARARRLKS